MQYGTCGTCRLWYEGKEEGAAVEPEGQSSEPVSDNIIGDTVGTLAVRHDAVP